MGLILMFDLTFENLPGCSMMLIAKLKLYAIPGSTGIKLSPL